LVKQALVWFLNFSDVIDVKFVIEVKKTTGKLENGQWTTLKRVQTRPKYSATVAFL